MMAIRLDIVTLPVTARTACSFAPEYWNQTFLISITVFLVVATPSTFPGIGKVILPGAPSSAAEAGASRADARTLSGASASRTRSTSRTSSSSWIIACSWNRAKLPE